MKREARILANVTFLLCAVLFFLTPALSVAQEFPKKTINLVVTFNPGGIFDICFRPLAARAEKSLGQPIVMSFNPGGGGSVALGIVAKEKPDGYRLVGCPNSSLIKIPQLQPVPYKLEDFTPVMQFGIPGLGLLVKADAPWKTLKEFVEYARKNPGKVTYSAIGTGTTHHLGMEYIAKREGIKWTMLPFGGRDGIAAVLGGHVTAISGSTADFVEHVKGGDARLLVVYSEKRMATYPDTPTLRELGYDFVNDDMLMVAGPKGLPASIVQKLDNALHDGMKDPDFIRTMKRMEVEIAYRSAEETRKSLETSYTRFGKFIKEYNIQPSK